MPLSATSANALSLGHRRLHLIATHLMVHINKIHRTSVAASRLDHREDSNPRLEMKEASKWLTMLHPEVSKLATAWPSAPLQWYHLGGSSWSDSLIGPGGCRECELSAVVATRWQSHTSATIRHQRIAFCLHCHSLASLIML